MRKKKNKQFSDENVCKANLSLAGVRQFDWDKSLFAWEDETKS